MCDTEGYGVAVELERVLARLGESRREGCVDLGEIGAHEVLAALAVVAPEAVVCGPVLASAGFCGKVSG